MKKLLIFLSLFLLGTCALTAVITDYYTFSESQGTYQAITGTVIPVLTDDDAISDAISIGFTFPYGTATYTDVKISTNGWIGLGTAMTGSNLTNAMASTTIVPIIAPLWDDLDEDEGSVAYEMTGTAPNRVFTVQYANSKWNYNGTAVNNFQVKLYENGKIEFIYGSFGTPNSPSASIGINMLPGGTDNYISVTPGTPSTSSTTTANNTVAVAPAPGTIYAFTPPVAVPNDLAVMSLVGNTTPTINVASPYVVNVRNSGTATQATYTVKLYNAANVELASVAGTSITAGQVLPITLNLTPTAVGPLSIYAKVILTGDANPANDQSTPLVLNVQPSGIQAVHIGTGTGLVNTIPLDLYYKSSFSQSIYYATELNASGQITGLTWFSNILSTDIPPLPVKIWMTETTATDLTTAFVPVTGMTLVFDGIVNFPGGINDITINFTTPFTYNGGNLLVSAFRPMDVDYYDTNDRFMFTDDPTHPGRTREYHSDTTAPIPEAPTAGTALTTFPNVTFYLLGGGGTVTGTVTSGAAPLAGVTVSVENSAQTTTTNATGVYTLQHVSAGAHNIVASKFGYATVTTPVTVVEEQTHTVNITMAPLPTVAVTGHVVANTNPAVGIANATINLTGVAPHTATTNASGDFTIANVLPGNYSYTVTATGYSAATGNIVVGTTPLNMGTLTVTETLFPATNVQASVVNDDVNVTWSAPDPNAVSITEGFEGTVFPPTGWSQVITNTGAAGTTGLFPTWCQIGTITFSTSTITPHGGVKQAALYWDYAHQDEWLITPQFVCPSVGGLTFWMSGHLGSTYLDHYYVKVSTNNGTTWTPLWDASAQPESDNTYTTPINIPLTAYAGQNIKLAWHAVDGDGQGLWYAWAIDDIQIGSPTTTLTFNANELTPVSYSKPSMRGLHAVSNGTGSFSRNGVAPVSMPELINDRPVIGYKVWRLLAGQETNEAAWTSLTPTTITALNYTDTTWPPAASGDYKYAVKAIYTGEVAAPAAFSNVVPNTINGTISGVVTDAGTNMPISGAVVNAGTATANTNASGVYTMLVPVGTYSVSVAAAGYAPATQNNVVVTAGNVTTQDFALAVSSFLLNESFESATFPPAGWTQVITNTGPVGTTGLAPTWGRVGVVTFSTSTITPQDGASQAGLYWDYAHQDEWLITPSFTFTASQTATLKFYTHVHYGSTYLDHYYVKISNNNGTTWTTLWDATALPEGDNEYTTEISIDLPAAMAGQDLKIAWQAVDGDGQGLWYTWFIDNVRIQTTDDNSEVPTPNVLVNALHNNYPNPFNPNTIIKYSVKQTAPVSLVIYNVKGEVVKTLVKEVVAAGNHSIEWSGKDNSNRNVASGVYFYKMNAGKYTSTKKMILMK